MEKFNAEKEVENVVNFIKDYYKKNNLGGAIIGISGGKDSAVAAGLLVKALGSENVLGLTLPCHSKDEDRLDAKLISDYYGFNLVNFDLTRVFDTFKDELKKLGNYSLKETENSDINLKPRLRMATLYYFAALYTKLTGKTYLVAGTSNKSELLVGYYTKGGDSVHDIGLLDDFYVDEVIEIGKIIATPEKVLFKTPSDGLSGKSDEEKLNFTYADVKKVFEGDPTVDEKVATRIRKAHNANLHKVNIPYYKKEK